MRELGGGGWWKTPSLGDYFKQNFTRNPKNLPVPLMNLLINVAKKRTHWEVYSFTVTHEISGKIFKS